MHLPLRSGLVLLLLAAGCSPAPPMPATTPPDEAPTEDGPHPVGLVDASIMFTDCPQVSNMNAKEAQRTMYRLVEGCDAVPGGTARFVATLSPDKRIEISSPEGSSGTVPICVLKHRLTHQVAVQKPCRMEVQMEERKETSPVGGEKAEAESPESHSGSDATGTTPAPAGKAAN
jgi:hypothetical protein